MSPKESQLNDLIKMYTLSLKKLLNITSAGILNGGDFTICEIPHKQQIDQQRFLNWICRHAYIDSFELAREVLNHVLTELFDEEITFSEKALAVKKKNGEQMYKKEILHELKPSAILEILGASDNHKDFLDLFNQYKKNRNCLSHRLGFVTKDDKPPLHLSHFKFVWITQIDGRTEQFPTATEAIVRINNSPSQDRRVGILTSHKKLSSYGLGSQLIVNPSNVYSISKKLYENLSAIFTSLLSAHANDIEGIMQRNDPFKINVTCEINSN